MDSTFPFSVEKNRILVNARISNIKARKKTTQPPLQSPLLILKLHRELVYNEHTTK